MTQSVERVLPYEGNEPYIFVSYSHRDMNRVMPIVKALIEHGYRLWYDEGIDPGSEWPESIARHLAESTVCMYFISNNSLASSNCKREVNFAVSRNIGFLSVTLEEVEIPLGLELQISTYMSLIKYKYPSEQAFMNRLLDLEILKPCLKEKEEVSEVTAETAAVPADEDTDKTVQAEGGTPEDIDPKPETPAPEETSEMTAEAGIAPVIEDTKVQDAAQAEAENLPVIYPEIEVSAPEEKTPEVKAETTMLLVTETVAVKETVQPKDNKSSVLSSKPKTPAKKESRKHTGKEEQTKTVSSGNKKSIWKYIIPGVLAAALLIAVILINPFNSKTIQIGDTEYEKNSYLDIREETITEKDIKSIVSYGKCTALYFTDCTFTGQASDLLGDISDLFRLELTDCSGINNLLFVEKLEKLHYFVADSCGITDAMLTGVSFPESCSGVSMYKNQLSAIPDLSKCKSLTELNLNYNSITSIDTLSSVPKIEKLYLTHNQISDISVLETFIYLKEIGLSSNNISTLEPLHNCTALSNVGISYNSEITDLSVIAANSKTLTQLWACGLPNADFSVLLPCTKLQMLNINSCALSDLEFTKRMSNLKFLNAADNQISDLSPLSLCSKLQTINLAGNQLTSLKGFPQPSSDDDLYILLHGNQLTDLSGLPASNYIRILTIYNNPWQNARHMNGLEGNHLVIDYTTAFSKESLKAFMNIYVLSVDLSEQLELENILGSRLQYTTEEEILPVLANEYNYSYIVLP